MLAVIMAGGLAVESARFHNARDVIQQNLDATLLHVAKLKNSEDGEFDAQQAAQEHMAKLKRYSQIGGGEIAVSLTEPKAGHMKAEALATMPSIFGRFFGHSGIGVKVASEVELGESPVEVALVLDNTGSMAGAKLDALKSAATSLIDIAYEPENAEDNVKIGIVPFAQYVNVGMTNRNAPWMDVPVDYSTNLPEVCYSVTPVTGTSNCRTENQTYMVDGAPTTASVQVCDYQYGPPETQCYTPVDSSTWYGCAGSRSYPLDTLDDDYSTPIPGVPNASCPSEITPLTNDPASLKSDVSNMVATGDTYIPSGLIWGMRVLSKIAPYEEAKGKTELVKGQKVRKIMVLMTDGLNSLSPTYPAHNGSDMALSNSLTAEICTNAKAQGIEVFTVAFDVADETIKNVLQGCASSGSKYFDASDSADLEESFREIAQEFNPLRITR